MITAAIAGTALLIAVVIAAINAGRNAAIAVNQINAGIRRDTRAALVDDAAEQADTDEEAGVL